MAGQSGHARVYADWQALGRAVRSKALKAVSLHLAAVGALEGDPDADEGPDADGGDA